jgi:heme/copper-type cytochrome/quinol oxidase subunit 2
MNRLKLECRVIPCILIIVIWDNGSLYSTSNVVGHKGRLIWWVLYTLQVVLCRQHYAVRIYREQFGNHPLPEILDWTVRNATSYDYYSWIMIWLIQRSSIMSER